MSFLIKVIEPDFLQELIIASLAFILPLEKRTHWMCRFIGVSLITLGFYSITNYFISINYPYESYFEELKKATTAMEYVKLTGLNYIVVLILPLLFCYLIFLFTTKLSFIDCLYGLSCTYVVQHIGFMLCANIFGEEFSDIKTIGLHYCFYIPIVFLIYWVFARYITIDGHYHISLRHSVISFVFIILMAMFLNMFFRTLQIKEPRVLFVVSAYDIFACIFILWLQGTQRKELELQYELMAEKQIFKKTEAQYLSSKENIDIINQKCHDLKHQIAALRDMPDERNRWDYINEIEAAVSMYDASIFTGNPALDTILTEKSLICEKNNFNFTCMADGSLLNRINAVDLYTLLGNALDNCIEACQRIKADITPAISITITKSGMYALIDIENTSDIIPDFEDELPKSVKEDSFNHGLGSKSIKSIVSKYNGTMQISVTNSSYRLAIAIPIES